MPTRNVVLTDHQSILVEELVRSGRYQNASEVLREGLRLIEAREALQSAKLEALRSAARAGEEDIESGRYDEFTDMAAMRRHLASLVQSAIGDTGPSRSDP